MSKRAKQDELITPALLARSRTACGRCEREIWRLLIGHSVTIHTPADVVIRTLTLINRTPPDWCSPDAWTVYCRVFGRWARVFGSLETFQRLGNEPEPEMATQPELVEEVV